MRYIDRPTGPRLRHPRGRGSPPRRLGRSLCAGQSERSRDAGGTAAAGRSRWL
jgi:hypothetical protein